MRIKIKFWKRRLSNISDKAKIGKGCTIHSHVWIGDDVIIGNNVSIQAFAYIPNGVTLEDNVFIGPRVTFTNDKKPPSHGKYWAKTLVREGAKICASVTVLPGIIIGPNAMVGAHSNVTRDVEDGATVMGNPARAI